MNAIDLLRPFEKHIGAPYTLWPDGGFFSGGEDTTVKGVLLTWMATVDALEKAVSLDCNVVFCHEPPLFHIKSELPPYRWLTPETNGSLPDWHPNRKRLAVIEKAGLTVIQSHYGWDRYCMFDAFARLLGLTHKTKDHGWESVYQLPEAMTVEELAHSLRGTLNFTGPVRTCGEISTRVNRVSLLWGGMGLSQNIYWVEQAIKHGAQCGIAGEMDEFFMRFVSDCRFPVIETSHQVSEEAGVCQYAADLRRLYPQLKVVVFTTGRPCRLL